jgi:hypothetical protein
MHYNATTESRKMVFLISKGSTGINTWPLASSPPVLNRNLSHLGWDTMKAIPKKCSSQPGEQGLVIIHFISLIV